MPHQKQLYGVWCKDHNHDRGDWLRDSSGGILVFEGKRKAMSRAAGTYGFATYTEAKRKDWVVVKPFAMLYGSTR